MLQCDEKSVQQLLNAAESILHASESVAPSCTQLDKLTEHAYQRMSSVYQKAAAVCWRRMYTDACILRTLADLMYDDPPKTSALLCAAVGRLDKAVVIAGACGDGRLELIQDLILEIQTDISRPSSTIGELPPSAAQRPVSLPATFAAPVPRLEIPPSLATFISRLCDRPFVLPGFIRDWPAMNDHPWKSLEYLRSVAGPGRIVPIEVGSDYRSDDWTQKMMDMDDFLGALHRFAHGNPDGSPILYLAQHSIFMQFPALRDDIIVPDYLYASPPVPDNYPDYKPPRNEEQLVMNAWLGPGGTISPAHTVGSDRQRGASTITDLLPRTLSTTATVSRMLPY